jgi:hypothetical protein
MNVLLGHFSSAGFHLLQQQHVLRTCLKGKVYKNCYHDRRKGKSAREKERKARTAEEKESTCGRRKRGTHGRRKGKHAREKKKDST